MTKTRLIGLIPAEQHMRIEETLRQSARLASRTKARMRALLARPSGMTSGSPDGVADNPPNLPRKSKDHT